MERLNRGAKLFQGGLPTFLLGTSGDLENREKRKFTRLVKKGHYGTSLNPETSRDHVVQVVPPPQAPATEEGWPCGSTGATEHTDPVMTLEGRSTGLAPESVIYLPLPNRCHIQFRPAAKKTQERQELLLQSAEGFWLGQSLRVMSGSTSPLARCLPPLMELKGGPPQSLEVS